MAAARIIARHDNGDVFADFNADVADMKHYMRNGYKVTPVARHWTDDTIRGFVRQEQVLNAIRS